MSISDALLDLVMEVKNGKDFDATLVEVAADYEINPIILRRNFDARFPNGIPDIDPAGAHAELIERTIAGQCRRYGVPVDGVQNYTVGGTAYAVICRDRRATVWAHAVRLSDGVLMNVRMTACSPMKKAA